MREYHEERNCVNNYVRLVRKKVIEKNNRQIMAEKKNKSNFFITLR
jgi:hypothetical protein